MLQESVGPLGPNPYWNFESSAVALLVLLTFTCGSKIANLLVPQCNCKHDLYNKTFMASKVWKHLDMTGGCVLYMHIHNFAGTTDWSIIFGYPTLK